MRRFARIVVSIVAVAAFTGCEQIGQGGDDRDPDMAWLAPCERPDAPALTGFYADSLCGTIEVPEDPAAPQGRQISLAVMVTPALSANARPDPIVFLAGGPGQAARQVGPLVFSRLDDLRVHRDLVFVDQRGTGASSPLDCGIHSDFAEDVGRSTRAITERQIQALRTCLGELDADPALYTTLIAMDDLDKVRERLGYDQINLYGISYGTRAGLIYMRRHGAHVRSAVLDGVAPTTMQIPDNLGRDAAVAFEKLLIDCKSSETCSEAFPDLRRHFEHLMKRLRLAPEEVTLVHPRTGKSISTRMDGQVVSALIRAVLYDRTLSSLLPFALEEAFHVNYQPLVTLAYSFTGDERTMTVGMMVSVLCSEDMKFMDGVETPNGHFANPLGEVLGEVCRFWPAGAVSADYNEPVTSDLPVLLISGQLDPVTPPAYAEEASETLTNSKHLVVPGVGHGASVHGCLPRMLKNFFDDPVPGGLDTGCVDRLARPPFFTGYAGPVPVDMKP